MNPGQLKVAAIALALLSLGLLTVAIREWTSRRGDSAISPATPGQGTWSSGLILFAVAIVVVGGLVVCAGVTGWPRDRTLWIGTGAFLVLLTLTRPWWFWENWKARALRKVIGDEATAVVYLAVGGVMMWVGLATDWTFGRR